MKMKQEKSNQKLISTAQLKPNNYNPNRMTEAELKEFIAEVKHLKRLPKPIVVRPGDNGEFVIVDGEHAWKTAKEVGLKEILCEVIEVDDFEAMRQTYKRNQHGTHNKVLLAKMFKRMGQERGLSIRKLAKEIEVTEGTIRNTIEYLKAVKVRNSYAPNNDSEAEIAGLSMRQVHLFNRLPTTLGNMWIDSGADMKVFLGKYKDLKSLIRSGGYACHSSGNLMTEEEYINEFYGGYEKSGLLQYIKPVRSPEQFRKALEQIKEWSQWESKYFWNYSGAKIIYTLEEFRKYTHYYYAGIWPFNNDVRWMEYALNMIIKHDDKQASFRITPEEFNAVVGQITDYCREESKGISGDMFEKYFSLAVYEKTGERVEARKAVNIRERFMQAEIDREAPDWIRESKLPFVINKYAIWKVMGELQDENDEDKARIEAILRDLAEERFIPRDKNCLMNKSDRKLNLSMGVDVTLEEEKWAVWAYTQKMLVVMKAEEHRDTAGNIELAMEVADYIYTNRNEAPEAHKKMSLILSQLQEGELKQLHKEITYCKMVNGMRILTNQLA